MAVLTNRYTISSTQKLPAGSTFIPASQIKSNTVQKQTVSDNYRPISYSSEMKQAAKKAGAAGQYYLWQDNPDATGSAAWMEKQLKNRGIDLSSKSNTGNAVADFVIEAGKGVIEIPIGLKRTFSAGALGAVGISKQSAGEAVKTLSEGTDRAIKSTVDSAIDNPGRFTGAVVGGIALTKGIGKLSAVPKGKVTTSKTTTKTNPTITTTGTKGAVSTTTRTISVSAGKKSATLTLQKSKTATGTQRITTAGVTNTKTGSTKAARVVKSKDTTVQRGDRAINSMLKSRKITVTKSVLGTKSISKKGVVKEAVIGKRSETTVSKGGNLKVQGREVITKTETRSGKSIKKGNNTAVKKTIRRTENTKRSLTTNGKTKTRKTGSRQRGTKYTLNDKPYNPNAISKKDKKILNKSAKARTKEIAKKERLRKKADRAYLRSLPVIKLSKNKSTQGKKSKTVKQTKPTNDGVIGTIYIKQKPKTSGTGGSTSNHVSSNGMMYQTKSRSTNQQKATGTYQPANILRTAQPATKTATKQKVRGAVISTKQKATASKTTSSARPANTTIKVKTATKTTTASIKSDNVIRNTKPESKSKTGAAIAVTQAHRRTTAQAKKQAQKQKQNEMQKRAQAQKKKQKKLLRLRDEEKKKKLQKAKAKKSKGYVRSETRNRLSWISDNSKLMKEKKIKN